MLVLWVDLTRSVLYILLPLSIIIALILVSQGVVQTFSPNFTAQLIHKVWGTSYEDEARLLRVNISNLQHKIEPDPNHPEYILTELGVGYRLRDV